MPSRSEELRAEGKITGGSPVIHIEPRTGKSHFLMYPDIQPDSPSWFAWLERDTTKSFEFFDWGGYDDECLCHVIKQDGIWYAYREGDKKKVRKLSLGPSQQVTIAALWKVYQMLRGMELAEQGFVTPQ